MWLYVCVNDLHMVQLMSLPPIISSLIEIQIGLTFLVPAYPGCLDKEAVRRISLLLSDVTCNWTPSNIIMSVAEQ